MVQKKQSSRSLPAPQTVDESAEWVAKYGLAQREIERLTAEMNTEISEVTARYEEVLASLREQRGDLHQGIQAFAEANKLLLTKGGRKSVKTIHGRYGWRETGPYVKTHPSDKKVVDYLMGAGIRWPLRVKYELDKTKLLAEPDRAKKIPGIKIRNDETFFVEPAKVEEPDVV